MKNEEITLKDELIQVKWIFDFLNSRVRFLEKELLDGYIYHRNSGFSRLEALKNLIQLFVRNFEAELIDNSIGFNVAIKLIAIYEDENEFYA